MGTGEEITQIRKPSIRPNEALLTWICLHFLQKVFNGEKYGAVTLITSYKRPDSKLHVEVLNAVNLIPLDSNGEKTNTYYAGYSVGFIEDIDQSRTCRSCICGALTLSTLELI